MFVISEDAEEIYCKINQMHDLAVGRAVIVIQDEL